MGTGRAYPGIRWHCTAKYFTARNSQLCFLYIARELCCVSLLTIRWNGILLPSCNTSSTTDAANWSSFAELLKFETRLRPFFPVLPASVERDDIKQEKWETLGMCWWVMGELYTTSLWCVKSSSYLSSLSWLSRSFIRGGWSKIRMSFEESKVFFFFYPLGEQWKWQIRWKIALDSLWLDYLQFRRPEILV